MNPLKLFVRLNRNLSLAAANRFSFLSIEENYTEDLRGRILARIKEKNRPVVLEVGGVDRPLLVRSADYHYIGVDIEERPSCKDLYDEFIVQSVENPMPVKADVLCSITLLEHVPDNVSSFRSMYASLKPGGFTAHYVPSKWHPYAVCLRLVGPTLQKKLIALLRPDAAAVTGYPAFFNWCTEPGMKRLAAKTGFTEVRTTCIYGANDYFAFFFPAFILVTLFENMCRRLGWTIFAAGFIIEGRKPLVDLQSQDQRHPQ